MVAHATRPPRFAADKAMIYVDAKPLFKTICQIKGTDEAGRKVNWERQRVTYILMLI